MSFSRKGLLLFVQLSILLSSISVVCAQSDNSTDTILVEVEDGSYLPESSCVEKHSFVNGTEDVIDDLESFGITDEHAKEFTDWIVMDVVKSVVNSSGELECFPPNRTDEMGTRLGNMIAQDIAGERPEKRGREVEVLPFATLEPDELEEEDDGALIAEEDLDEEMELSTGVTTVTTAERQAKKNPFNWGSSAKKWAPKPKAPANQCCKCPANHYPSKWEGKCAKGPCCPNLCKTLERLAGILSLAKFSCCKKANRACTNPNRKVQLALVWNKKPVFKFNLVKKKKEASQTWKKQTTWKKPTTTWKKK